MQVAVTEAALAELPCTTRLPFRFGATTVQAAPLLHARVRIESVDGRSATGMAADLLVPKWFRKDPSRTVAEDQAELVASAEAAAARLRGGSGHRTAFAHWHAAYRELVQQRPPAGGEPLVAGFGLALFERALLDAVCRLARASFWSALQKDLFGIRLDQLDRGLDGVAVRDLLPATARTAIELRHTVGMLDPLRDDEVGPTAPRDGAPVSLQAVLAVHGVRWLKVKIGQAPAVDRARLLAIAALLRAHGRAVRIVLDGNEQFASLGALADLLDAVAAEPAGRELLAALVHIEQPLPRAASFDPALLRGHERVAAFAPLVLDEADATIDSFPQALAAGWRGCSIKNCKGVFRGLLNFARCKAGDGAAFVTAEDLTNLPLLPLQQDLATVLALGLPHVERNGHHYFPGLDHLPAEVTAAALLAHGDLYAARGSVAGTGGALRIADGRLACASLLGPGYGCDQEPFDLLLAALPWRLLA